MLSVVRRAFPVAVVGDGVQQPTVEEPQRCVLGVAKPLAGLDDLVEHGLKACGTRDGAQNAADRPLLLPKGLEFAL
jgi:hypothetical protein